ncbi:MAG TPA: replicative DNA helicase [Candidatus Coprenecus stercorigallinarum]|nr:replicative DNA helicase [Candidatus Coprenecus stercorigallinarum]
MAKTTRPKKKEVSIDAIGIETGKVPPQAVDVEEAVLGAMMIEPNCVPDVLDSLTADCFYKEANRKVFMAISSLSSEHQPVDIYTVSEELKRQGSIDEIGGPYYLSLLSSRVGAAAHVEYHVKILLQKYIQRELITISAEMQRDSFDDSIPVDDLLDNSQSKLFELAERNMKRATLPVQDVIKDTVAEIEANQDRTDGLSGLPSGFTGIDKITLGWQASDLVIIAARPAMGKTAFVLTMARNMAVDHRIPVAFFSLEMSSKQLVKRLLVSETGLSSEKIRGGKKLLDYELVQLHERIKDLTTAPLFIDDTPSISVYELRSKARRLVRNAGVKLIIIDYLQLMTGPPELRGMREQEVSNISRSLKAIAKELDIPVIALSQLSRAVETRGGNKRPQLSDLRESGAIEQDADIVMFIHRPEYYGTESETSVQGEAQVIIAKHRNGSTADVPMRFRASEARFVDANDDGFISPDDDIEGYRGVESSMNNSEFDADY